LDEEVLDPQGVIDGATRGLTSFMGAHVDLAKKLIASAEGTAMFGPNGYLPTATGWDHANRTKAAQVMILALHLLLEEQKLTVLAPEETSPGPSDLKSLLCLLTEWLGWSRFHEVYRLGVQSDCDDCSGKYSFFLP